MKLLTCVALAATTFLAACGGGGGGAGGIPFAGSVIDGKIKGAVVCLDVNSNVQCDANEPTTTTDAEGKYAFTYKGTSIDGMHVLALVGIGAVDSDSGPVTTAYNMLAPATAPSYVTPVTTLVSSEMISSNTTAAEAEKSVKASLDITTDLLNKNVMEDANLHKISQVTTVAIAESMASLNKAIDDAKKTDAKDTSAKDLTTSDVLKQSVNLVRTQVLTQVVGAGGVVTVDTTGSQKEILAKVESGMGKTVAQTVSGSIDNIVAASKSGDGTQVDLAAVFKRGLIIADQESHEYINPNGVPPIISFTDRLTAEFLQFDIATVTNPPATKRLVQINNSWLQRYEGGQDYSFDGSNWVPSGNSYQGKPTINGNCISIPIVKNSDITQTYCAIGKNLAGKPINDFIKDVDAKAVFPADSIGYDLTFTLNKDVYTLWSSPTWQGYKNGNNAITQITGNSGLIAYLKTNTICLGSNCQIGGLLASGDKSSMTGTIKWGSSTNGSVTSFPEITNFSVITIGGKELLKVELPNLFRKLNPSDQHAYGIWGFINGGMYSGDFTPANFKQSIPFTGNPSKGTQVVSPALFDAVLAQKGAPKFPY